MSSIEFRIFKEDIWDEFSFCFFRLKFVDFQVNPNAKFDYRIYYRDNLFEIGKIYQKKAHDKDKDSQNFK